MSKRPGWFIILAAVLVLWGLAGCASFYAHVAWGPKLAADAGPWDEAYYAALPAWFAWDYGVAVIAGLLGSVALLARSRFAAPLYAVSLIAVAIQFGYVFLATDMLAHKGAAATVPFPLFIVAMAAFQLWLARYAARRGWA